MPVRLSTEISIHDAARVIIECPKGFSGRRWFAITFIDRDGGKTELAVWAPGDEAPELLVQDEVSLRRFKTIDEEEVEE